MGDSMQLVLQSADWFYRSDTGLHIKQSGTDAMAVAIHATRNPLHRLVFRHHLIEDTCSSCNVAALDAARVLESWHEDTEAQP